MTEAEHLALIRLQQRVRRLVEEFEQNVPEIIKHTELNLIADSIQELRATVKTDDRPYNK